MRGIHEIDTPLVERRPMGGDLVALLADDRLHLRRRRVRRRIHLKPNRTERPKDREDRLVRVCERAHCLMLAAEAHGQPFPQDIALLAAPLELLADPRRSGQGCRAECMTPIPGTLPDTFARVSSFAGGGLGAHHPRGVNSGYGWHVRHGAVTAILALVTAGVTPAAAHSASDGIIVRSHFVERVLPRDRNRTLPVHEGGTVAIKVTAPVRLTTVRWGARSIRVRRLGDSGRRWRFEVPRGAVPGRARLVGERAGRRFRRQVRLREHDHRPVETAPGRLIDGREVFWIDWVFGPRSLRELFSAAPESFLQRPTVETAIVATVVRTTRAHIPDDHPDYEIPAQHIHLRTTRRWFGRVGQRFRVLKTGNEDVWAAGDPRYQPGERYVLFMDRRPDGVFIPVAPEGRYLVKDGTLWPVIAGRLGRIFSGLTVQEARSVAILAHRRSRPG